mmetsp:Transcript_6413/g.13894  ORF Transcript_6413/g.13894 Transcript_6413/m.13894 type:complete len:129 (+) Transcript_6413:1781-2167(+)
MLSMRGMGGSLARANLFGFEFGLEFGWDSNLESELNLESRFEFGSDLELDSQLGLEGARGRWDSGVSELLSSRLTLQDIFEGARCEQPRSLSGKTSKKSQGGKGNAKVGRGVSACLPNHNSERQGRLA